MLPLPPLWMVFRLAAVAEYKDWEFVEDDRVVPRPWKDVNSGVTVAAAGVGTGTVTVAVAVGVVVVAVLLAAWNDERRT